MGSIKPCGALGQRHLLFSQAVLVLAPRAPGTPGGQKRTVNSSDRLAGRGIEDLRAPSSHALARGNEIPFSSKTWMLLVAVVRPTSAPRSMLASPASLAMIGSFAPGTSM
jgi:hypothetical protein